MSNRPLSRSGEEPPRPIPSGVPDQDPGFAQDRTAPDAVARRLRRELQGARRYVADHAEQLRRHKQVQAADREENLRLQKLIDDWFRPELDRLAHGVRTWNEPELKRTKYEASEVEARAGELRACLGAIEREMQALVTERDGLRASLDAVHRSRLFRLVSRYRRLYEIPLIGPVSRRLRRLAGAALGRGRG